MIVGITGGSGFIGKALVDKHLSLGDQVRVLSRKNRVFGPGVQVFLGNLLDPNLAAGKFFDGADVLYHCAGEIKNPEIMADVHIKGSRRLFEQAVGRVGRWVHLSSVGVYGRASEDVVTESTRFNPIGSYEITKAAGERQVFELSRKLGLPAVVLRPSNVIGVAMPNPYLAKMVRAINGGYFFFLGPVGAQASYIDVRNVVQAMCLCGTHKEAPGNDFIISDDRPLEALVDLVCERSDRGRPQLRLPVGPIREVSKLMSYFPAFPLNPKRVDALTTRTKYSIGKIQSILGYRHSVSYEQAIGEFVDWALAKK